MEAAALRRRASRIDLLPGQLRSQRAPTIAGACGVDGFHIAAG
jgi:hypothetical protein